MEGTVRRVRDSCKEAGILETAVSWEICNFTDRSGQSIFWVKGSTNKGREAWCLIQSTVSLRGTWQEVMGKGHSTWGCTGPLAFLGPPEPCVEIMLALYCPLWWLRVKELCFRSCVYLESAEFTSKVRRPNGLLLRFELSFQFQKLLATEIGR